MPVAPFSRAEVKRILQLSENSTLPDGKRRGHAGERHVSIPNTDLHNRMRFEDATVAGIAIYTAFLTFDDQIDTAFAILNAPQAAPLLEAFYAKPHQKQCPLRDIVLTNSVRFRMAVGGEKQTHTYSHASFGTMYLHRHAGRPRSLHVASVFVRPAVQGYDP